MTAIKLDGELLATEVKKRSQNRLQAAPSSEQAAGQTGVGICTHASFGTGQLDRAIESRERSIGLRQGDRRVVTDCPKD